MKYALLKTLDVPLLLNLTSFLTADKIEMTEYPDCLTIAGATVALRFTCTFSSCPDTKRIHMTNWRDQMKCFGVPHNPSLFVNSDLYHTSPQATEMLLFFIDSSYAAET